MHLVQEKEKDNNINEGENALKTEKENEENIERKGENEEGKIIAQHEKDEENKKETDKLGSTLSTSISANPNESLQNAEVILCALTLICQ